MDSPQNKYDLIVIGAGPAGYVAAIKAAQLGKSVAVTECREVGGTCLNRGCIPTKTLLHTAELLHQIKEGAKIGLRGDAKYDNAAMKSRKEEVAAGLRSGIETLLKSNKVNLINGRAFIEAPGKVRIGENIYECEKILAAAGSRPAMPPIQGSEHPDVVTSDELLSMEREPYKSLVIVGGGVIGVEFATAYSFLGCSVTIIEAMERILPGLDREISQNLTMILKKRGVRIYTNSMLEKIEPIDGLKCTFSSAGNSESVQCDGVLVSVGRKPNTEGLFAENIAAELCMERGQIPVTETFETRVPGIYAAGDVVKGGIQLAHAASAQGVNAVCAMFDEKPQFNLTAVPSCIYTDPEIATVGLTADEAKASGLEIKTGKFIMSANGKSVIELSERGFIKLVFDESSKALIGAQLMCRRATDLISELATAVVNKLTTDELLSVVRPHPTFSEAVTEAAEDAWGTPIHAAPRRK